MVTIVADDMFTGEAIADPYSYYGKLRDEDPVHWNELYELWVITGHDDLVWMTRHHELFSSEFWKRDKRSPYPAIDESDMGLYQFMREFFMDWRPRRFPRTLGSCGGQVAPAALIAWGAFSAPTVSSGLLP